MNLLAIGGALSVIPYAWDSLAISAFSASSGKTELPTFSGVQAVDSWESNLAIFGAVLIAIFILFRIIL